MASCNTAAAVERELEVLSVLSGSSRVDSSSSVAQAADVVRCWSVSDLAACDVLAVAERALGTLSVLSPESRAPRG